MIFTQPVTDLIRRRFSCRKYLPQPIPAQTQDELRHFLEFLPLGPFGSLTRFQLITATEQDRSALKGLGTYGFIRGATAFIAGAVEPAKMDMEDFGYAMEKAILFATDLGLGTCWLGGTFTRSGFARRIRLKDDETIPAVTATGLVDDPEQARRGLIRQFAADSSVTRGKRCFSRISSPFRCPRMRPVTLPLPLRWCDLRLLPQTVSRGGSSRTGISGIFTCAERPATAKGFSSPFAGSRSSASGYGHHHVPFRVGCPGTQLAWRMGTRRTGHRNARRID